MVDKYRRKLHNKGDFKKRNANCTLYTKTENAESADKDEPWKVNINCKCLRI